MKRYFSLIFAAVVPLLLMCWRPFEVVGYQIVAAWRTVKTIAVTGILSVLGKFQAHVWRTCRSVILKADSYILRLAKRERPELTGGWRLCPST